MHPASPCSGIPLDFIAFPLTTGFVSCIVYAILPKDIENTGVACNELGMFNVNLLLLIRKHVGCILY